MLRLTKLTPAVPLVAVLMLGACVDRGIAPKSTAAADSADQVIAGMSTNIVRNGVRQGSVYADSAWMYELRGVNALKGMTVTMFDSNGAMVSKITADKGLYGIRDQNVDARGHVVATSPDGKVLKTEHRIYDNRQDLVWSDSAFTSTSPQGNVSGAHFEADPGFKRVVVNKPKGVQKGKGIALPGPHGVSSE